MGVENRRQVLLGLAAWHRGLDIEHGVCLISDFVAVFDLIGGIAVATRLVDALEDRARALGCRSLQVHVVGDPAELAETPLVSSLLARDHRVEGTRLCKFLARKRYPALIPQLP